MQQLEEYVKHIGGSGAWNDVITEFGKPSLDTPEDLIRILRISASTLNREYQFFLYTFAKWMVTIGNPSAFTRYTSPYNRFSEFMSSADAVNVIVNNIPWHENTIEIKKNTESHFTIYYRSKLRLFSLIKGIYAGLAELMGVSVLVRHRAKGAELTLIDVIVG